MDQLTNLAIAGGLAWASGIRLYAVLFIIGLAGRFQLFGWQIPGSLDVLSHTFVLATTGVLLFLEFFADKIPGLDSIWDAIHTFVRIPAGALLAMGAMGQQDSAAWAIVVGLVGGTITAGTHFTKAGTRALLNTSPEPVSNVTASVTEDVAVLGGLWLAFANPVVFLLLLVLFVLVVIWVLPKIWRLIKYIVNRILAFVSGAPQPLRPT